MQFNDILRNLIEERGITQKRLAGDLNIAASTMGGYVQGTSEPDFDTLKTLSRYFNVSTDYMLGSKVGNANNEMENELLRIFRTMTKQQQDMYLEQGKAVLKVSLREKNGYVTNNRTKAS